MARVAGSRRPGTSDKGDEAESTREASSTRIQTPVVKSPARRRPSPSARVVNPPAAPAPVDNSDEPVAVAEPLGVEQPPAAVAGRSWLAVLVAVVLALGVLCACGWLVYLQNRPSPAAQQPVVSDAGIYTPGTISDSTGHSAVQAAVWHLPQVLSYDYRTLDADLAKSLPALTPGFAAQFTSTFTTVVRPVATKNKAVVKALVRAAGLASRSGDSVSVLVFIDEALVSSGGATAPKISQDRVKVTLLRSNNRWLIDSITPL